MMSCDGPACHGLVARHPVETLADMRGISRAEAVRDIGLLPDEIVSPYYLPDS
jgi:hypothetical protein